VDKDYRNSKTSRDNPVDEQDSDTSKDIKKGMDKFEAKIKAGEAPIEDQDADFVFKFISCRNCGYSEFYLVGGGVRKKRV
jgi:hypothetical protein